MKQTIAGWYGSSGSYTYRNTIHGASARNPNWHMEEVFPAGGIISNFRVNSRTAPGVSTSFYFTIYVNGVARMTAYITGTNTSGENTSDTVEVSAGSNVSIAIGPVGGATASDHVSWAFDYDCDSATESILLTNQSNNTNFSTTTRYFPPSFACNYTYSGTTESLVQIPFKAGKLKHLFFYGYVSGPVGYMLDSTVTVRVNGVDTDLSATLVYTVPDPNPGRMPISTTNTTDEVDVEEGDLVSVKMSATTVGANGHGYWGFIYEPTDGNRPMLMCSTYHSPYASTTNIRWSAPFDNLDFTEWYPDHGRAAMVSTARTIGNLHVKLSTPPGAGRSYTLALVKNGVDTAVSVVISGTDTEGSTEDTVEVEDGDTLSIKSTPSGYPAQAYMKWWLWQNLEPTDIVMGGMFVRGNEIQAVFSNNIGAKAYRSPDFGATWYAISGMSGEVTDVGFNAEDPQDTFLGAVSKLYEFDYATSGGAYYVTAGADIVGTVTRIDVDKDSPVAIVGTSSKLYKTMDWGASVYTLLEVPITSVAIGGVETVATGVSLIVQSPTGGTCTEPGIGEYDYTRAQSVHLLAVPASGYTFSGWAGDTERITDVDAADTYILMVEDYTIVPHFIPE